MLLFIRLINYTCELIEKFQFLDKIWLLISFSKLRCISKPNLTLIPVIIFSMVRIFSFLDLILDLKYVTPSLLCMNILLSYKLFGKKCDRHLNI